MASREHVLISAFVDLADTMVDDYDVLELLDRLVGYCVALYVADTAGIMLADGRGLLHVMATTDVHTEWIELVQVQADEGPCVESFRSGQVVSVPDLSDVGHRWPRFAAGLRDTPPYHSVCAVPLRLRGETVGVLNLFRRERGELDGDDLALGQALADVATIGILQERAIRRGEALNDQMQTALHNRLIIEQAKGILAERGDLDVDAAFTRLRLYARARGLRPADVARGVVEGDLAVDVLAVAEGTSIA
ncbi:ANTAR domain-containing protein [Pseudonocardia saturnea]